MADMLQKQIIGTLNQTAAVIKVNMDAAGVNASGRTSDSIHVRPYEGGVQLVGGRDGTHTIPAPFQLDQRNTAPIPTLEIGRPGGKVPMGFYYIIKQWTREKGMQFSSESERGTFAYFVSKKIAREGTIRHNLHPEDIYSTAVKEAETSIRKTISDYARNTIREAIMRFSTSTIATNF